MATVEPRVAHGLITVAEVSGHHFGTSPQALGDIVTGEFQVYAARMGAGETVGGEEAGDLGQHVFEVPGLATVVGSEGISVHGVAHPDHRVTRIRDR